MFKTRILPPVHYDGIFIWPRGGNTGDDLIKRGCLQYLQDIPMNVWASDGRLERAALKEDHDYLESFFSKFSGYVFFTGGGNIGIYPDNAKIRKVIIQSARSGPGVLVFPQSVFRVEESLKHKKVTVWAREQTSYELLRAAGVRTELVPDASFYVSGDIPKIPHGRGIFFIRRAPGRCKERIINQLMIDAPAADITYAHELHEIIEILKDYQLVISDRLHGAIISIMLGKKTVMLPVSYHKNVSFYRTWFLNTPGVQFNLNKVEIDRLMRKSAFPEIDLKSLFLDKARPAMERFLTQHPSGSI